MRIPHVFRRGELYAFMLIALSVVAFASVSFVGDSKKISAALSQINIELLLSLLGLAVINYVLRATRFQMFARRLGIRIPFGWMTVYYVAGFAMSATPGKFGELVRLWLIRQRHGYRIERSLPLQIADRAADVVASIVLCIGAIGAFSGYWKLVAGGGAVVVVGVVLLMKPALLYRGINGLYRGVSGKGRWLARLRRLIRRTAVLFKPQLFLPALVLSIIGWWAECLALSLCMQGIGGVSDLGRATFIFTFSNLVGGLTFLPGGVGGTEVTMVGFLVAEGIGIESAATVTAVIRLATLWFGTVLGLLIFAGLLRIKSVKHDVERPSERLLATPPEDASIVP